MEQADHQIRVLFFTDNLHPFACRLFHIVETQSFPQIFGEPCRDGRGNHSQYHDLHAITFQHFVRNQMGLSCRCIYDVGTQHWEVTSGDQRSKTARPVSTSWLPMLPASYYVIHHFRSKDGETPYLYNYSNRQWAVPAKYRRYPAISDSPYIVRALFCTKE